MRVDFCSQGWSIYCTVQRGIAQEAAMPRINITLRSEPQKYSIAARGTSVLATHLYQNKPSLCGRDKSQLPFGFGLFDLLKNLNRISHYTECGADTLMYLQHLPPRSQCINATFLQSLVIQLHQIGPLIILQIISIFMEPQAP